MKSLTDLEKIVNSELNTKINSSYINHEELRLTIDPGDISDVVLFLKNNPNTKFRQLIDITAVDYPESEKRFRLVYLLLSLEYNKRVRIDYSIKENDPINSLTSIYPAANWMEREVFDMYGIVFKDFPLTGHNEVRFNEESKKVIYEPVKLEQNYRNFDYESPWEGTKYIKKETDK